MPEKTVPCELCGEPTEMLGTKRCDFCWELEWRVIKAPLTTLKILLDNNLIPKKTVYDNYLTAKKIIKDNGG